MSIRVVIGDDNYLVREGIGRSLEGEEDMTLIATCDDLDSLRATIIELRPDAGESPPAEVSSPARATVATSDLTSTAIEHPSALIDAALACLERLNAARSQTELSETIPLLLVEVAGYDRAVLWRVERSRLAPVSAAFADDAEHAARALKRLGSKPPKIREFGVEAAVIGGAEPAAIGSVRADSPTSRILGQLPYAVAGIRDDNSVAGLIQASFRDRGPSRLDRDLLLVFAELCAMVLKQRAAAEAIDRYRARARALSEGIGDDPRLLGPAIEPRLRARSTASPRKITDSARDSALGDLTGREREVLTCLVAGASNVEIAEALCVTDETVKSHVRAILRKLGARRRAQVIAQFASILSQHRELR